MDLYLRLRLRTVLYGAWCKVRASGLSSGSELTRAETKEFERHHLSRLDRLQSELQRGVFRFSPEKGIAIPKGEGKKGFRPLIVGSISNRIVRRAILDVLQGYGNVDDGPRACWSGVAQIRLIMDTPTSVGGIPTRGVPHALSLIDEAVASKRTFFVRSDIQNFFTRIPIADVTAFVRSAVVEPRFCKLFEEALVTNLSNREELEERKLFALFPHPDVGVAQGSALSALAGNIALRRFDQALNGRGITCVRYIDDFILLGPSPPHVLSAYASGRRLLAALGMNAYDVEDPVAMAQGKVAMGNIYDGAEFLGYQISGRSRQPSQAAQNTLLGKVDYIIKSAQREMRAVATGNGHGKPWGYYQAMSALNEVVWGWGQAFRYSTAPDPLAQLEKRIDARVQRFLENTRGLVGVKANARKQILGLHALTSTRPCVLPEIGLAFANTKGLPR